LNRMFKQSQLPQVILVQLNGDTAVVRISNEQQLTQQMGSTGATSYLQAVTYTLTSLPGIDYVEFDFQEGDHAAPGRYSR
jgi:spore germination protein GerM